MENFVTAERLRHVLTYAPETGLFRWRNPTTNRFKVGDLVGCPNSAGYLRVTVDGRSYLLHRLAWLYVYEKWPPSILDHIDCDPLNNRIANLRECVQAQNIGNMRAPSHNTSGVKGVSFNKASGLWMASITKNRRARYLGRFETKELAAEAYAIAARAQWGEFARC